MKTLTFLKPLFLLFAMLLLSTSSWGLDACGSPRDSAALSSSNLQYERYRNNNDWNVGPNTSGTSNITSRSFYFSVASAGTVTIELYSIDNNQARFSYSDSVCPNASSGVTTKTVTFTSAEDFNVKVYYVTGSRSSIEYGLRVTFTPDSLPSSCLNLDSPDAADNPPGTIITSMHNIDTNITTCISGSSPNGDSDYYYFTVAADGILDMTASSPNGHDYHLMVGSPSDDNAYYGDTTAQNHTVPPITLLTGDSIYIYAKETGSDTDEYQINFSFTLLPQIPPTMENIPDQITSINTSFTLTLSDYVGKTNGDNILSYSLTNYPSGGPLLLPDGLAFNSLTGILSGTPTTVGGPYAFRATATDDDGVSNYDEFTLTITLPSADLSITMTDAPDPVIQYNTLQYTIAVTNNGPSDTENVTVTDILPTNVTYQSAIGTNWICDYTSSTRTISCVRPSLSNGTTTEDLIISVSAGTTNISNTASVTSTVTDSITSNNSVTKTTTVNSSSYNNNNPRPFTLYRQDNINGNMQIIGNSVKLDSANGGQCAANTTNNNDITAMYADRDADSTTFNSTSADLILPADVYSTDIKYALLFWQGRTTNEDNIPTGKTVKIKPFGQTAYQTVTSMNTKFNWINKDYQGVADVTDLIKNSINAVDTIDPTVIENTGYNKALWVADVYAPDNTNGFGAWSLVIVYQDNATSLKNISVYDGFTSVFNNTKEVTLTGFLTPTSGVVDSKFLIFGGEGDISLDDSVSLTDKFGDDQPLGDNVFRSAEDINGVNITARDPNCQNTIGVDIRTFSIGTNGTPAIIGNSQTTTTVKLTSSGDEYFPGVFAFSTELYVPDVCYLEDVTYNNQPITSANLPATGDNVEFEVTITNKDNEAAKGVFIEKEFDRPDEITYVPDSMQIAPIPGTTYDIPNKTDLIGDDTAEFSLETNTSKFLLGAGAEWFEGGTIVKDAITKFKYGATVGEDNASENTYLVSYRNDLLHITFTGIPIRKCQDFNNSFGVAGLLGAYNVVNEFGGASAFDDVTSPQTYLVTQVAGRPFNVKIISLNSMGDALLSANSDVNVSLIQTPNYASCSGVDTCMQNLCNTAVSLTTPVQITFAGASSMPLNNVIYSSASRNVSFKTTYNNGTQHACSLDSFAIRPDRFVLSAPSGEDIELLTSAQDYNLSLTAPQYALSTPTNEYNVSDVNDTVFDLNPTLYQKDGTIDNSLHGTLNFSTTTFTITNGSAFNAVGINFDDVGKVNIQLVDDTWAQVDIGNNDTLAECSATGAFICGDINATFIPANFALSAVSLYNNDGNVFTYLSNDLNMSAHVSVTLTAKNSLNATTQNFKQNSWENPVNVLLTPPAIVGMVSHKDDANETLDLGFATGVYTIPWNETNASKQLIFNYLRDTNQTINPFEINGSNLTVNAASLYTSSSAATKTVTGTSVADQNATFVYGRTNAPRQRFTGNIGTALIYYEVFCSGAGCDKSLLPNGVNSQSTNDPRWFKNTLHTPPINYGVVGPVSQKALTPKVTSSLAAGMSPDSVVLTYDAANANRTYPYKATMENNASSWLIYNQYRPAGTNTNEFEVEFESANNSWAGIHETNATTNSNASSKTNRRSMW